MYTYKKRIAAIALAALMGLSCIGCGKNDESSQPTATQAQTSAEVTTATTTTTTQTETTTAEETTAETTTQTTTSAKKKTTTTKKAAQTTTAATTAAPIVTNPPMPVVQAAVTDPPKQAASSSTLDSVVKNYPRSSSVILYCMDGKTLYSNDPNHVYYGASMIKLPYVYYCCTQLEKGIHSLDETVTYTDANYYPGSGVIIHRGSGKIYTVEQLIDYTLRYSDNVAYIMLIHMFGIDGFNKMMAEWGCGNVQLYTYNYFPNLTPDFNLTSMKKMQAMSTNKGRSWQAAWRALIGSEGLYIKQCFPNEAVAGKYGQHANVYHEACYFGGKEPYILIVMNEINSLAQCGDYLANVAAAARAEVNKYTAEKEAAAKAEAEKTATKATTTKPEATTPKTTKPKTTSKTTTTKKTSSVTEETTATTPETTPPETTVPEDTPQVTTPPETTQEITETYETILDTDERER